VVESKGDLPTKPGELISLDIYDPLPTGLGGVN
jgi:hypothetical protein